LSIKPTAIISLSGGLDSCVAAAIAKDNGYNLALLHIDYGQLTKDRERQAFNDIADFYNVCTTMRLITKLASLKAIGGSAITDTTIPIPKGQLKRDEVPISYVPFRNAHLLSTAVSWAEVLSASAIYVGFVEEDSSGYPDCSESFLKAFETTANIGTKPETKIDFHAPLVHMKKSEIVTKGLELKAPLELTWSCYQNESEACGQCDSCLLRLAGFNKARVSDPISYKKYLI